MKVILINIIKRISIFVVVAFLGCEVQNVQTNTSEKVCRILLADGFQNDTISLFIDDICIFDKVVLTSHGSLGITKKWVSVDRENSFFVISSSESQCKSKFRPVSNKIIIFVKNKTKHKVFKADIRNGIYIVVNQGKNNNFYFRQSTKMPVFD